QLHRRDPRRQSGDLADRGGQLTVGNGDGLTSFGVAAGRSNLIERDDSGLDGPEDVVVETPRRRGTPPIGGGHGPAARGRELRTREWEGPLPALVERDQADGVGPRASGRRIAKRGHFIVVAQGEPLVAVVDDQGRPAFLRAGRAIRPDVHALTLLP